MSTPSTVEAQIQSLIDQANATTGKTDTTLTDAVGSLMGGYGQGSGSESSDLFPYVANVTFGADIQEVTEDIVLHLERASNIGNLFDMKNLCCNKITVYINDNCNSMYRSFGRGNSDKYKLKEVEIIGNTSNVTTYSQCFYSNPVLERVIGAFDFSSVTTTNGTNYIFGYCSALQEFYPVPNTIKVSIPFASSPDLTDTTIQAIIDGLADLTGQTAQTITFHADVEARMTDEQKATITAKNWTLVVA